MLATLFESICDSERRDCNFMIVFIAWHLEIGVDIVSGAAEKV